MLHSVMSSELLQAVAVWAALRVPMGVITDGGSSSSRSMAEGLPATRSYALHAYGCSESQLAAGPSVTLLVVGNHYITVRMAAHVRLPWAAR